ncbi:Hypothetical predicted protein, partial [Pelobates cultripes]
HVRSETLTPIGASSPCSNNSHHAVPATCGQRLPRRSDQVLPAPTTPITLFQAHAVRDCHDDRTKFSLLQQLPSRCSSHMQSKTPKPIGPSSPCSNNSHHAVSATRSQRLLTSSPELAVHSSRRYETPYRLPVPFPGSNLRVHQVWVLSSRIADLSPHRKVPGQVVCFLYQSNPRTTSLP